MEFSRLHVDYHTEGMGGIGAIVSGPDLTVALLQAYGSSPVGFLHRAHPEWFFAIMNGNEELLLPRR
jgi:hypothetical protein